MYFSLVELCLIKVDLNNLVLIDPNLITLNLKNKNTQKLSFVAVVNYLSTDLKF